MCVRDQVSGHRFWLFVTACTRLGQCDAACLGPCSLYPFHSEHLTMETGPWVQILSLVPGASLTNLRLGLAPCSLPCRMGATGGKPGGDIQSPNTPHPEIVAALGAQG